MTTLPQPTDCCSPCTGARTACVVECGEDGSGGVAVPTTAALRAVPGPFTLYQMKNKLGDLVIDDGAGGDYYFDTNSFDADNGGSVVKPDSIDAGSPGRWMQHL